MAPARTILITGVTRGLGRALADRFSEAGHTVLGCGRTEERIGELQRRLGPPHAFCTVDVADEAQVAAWAQGLLEVHPAPDLLVNNAALINHNAPLWKIPAGEFDGVIDVNIKGVANVIRHFAPAMIQRRRGIIVNISSGWGRTTAAEVAPYCCTKWAMEGLTRSLAQELPEGMAAVALNPGMVDTDMLRSCFGAEAAHHPTAEVWSHGAAAFLLALGPEANGRSLDVP